MPNTLITNLSGGQNNKFSPLIIGDDQCELIKNYTLDKTGSLQKRKGYDVFATQPVSGKRVHGLFQYTNIGASGETTQVMVVNNSGDTQSVIYYNNGGTWTTSKTNDTAVSSFTNLNRARFVTFLDYIFRVNGQDVVATSNDINGGTWGTTNAPGTIKPSFVSVFQDRVYVANDRNGINGSRVFFSGLPSSGSITWTTGTDFFDVNPDDGDEITALENNGNRLLIFKTRALYRWTFGQTEPDRLIGVGTSSQECVKTNFDLGVTFFANEKGAYAYSGGRPKLISRAIKPWFDALSAGDETDFSAEVDNDHYFLYLADSLTVEGRTYTNVMAVYNIPLDAWTIYTLDTPVRVMNKLILSNKEGIYFGSDNGRTYEWEKGNSDDSGGASGNSEVPIDGEIITKEQMISFPERSDVQYIDVISKEGVQALVSVFFDDNPDPKQLGQLEDRVTNFEVRKDKVYTVKLRIADNSKNQSTIEGFNIEHEPVGRRL